MSKKDFLEEIKAVEAKKEQHLKNGRLDMVVACDKMIAVLEDEMNIKRNFNHPWEEVRYFKGRKLDD